MTWIVLALVAWFLLVRLYRRWTGTAEAMRIERAYQRMERRD